MKTKAYPDNIFYRFLIYLVIKFEYNPFKFSPNVNLSEDAILEVNFVAHNVKKLKSVFYGLSSHQTMVDKINFLNKQSNEILELLNKLEPPRIPSLSDLSLKKARSKFTFFEISKLTGIVLPIQNKDSEKLNEIRKNLFCNPGLQQFFWLNAESIINFLINCIEKSNIEIEEKFHFLYLVCLFGNGYFFSEYFKELIGEEKAKVIGCQSNEIPGLLTPGTLLHAACTNFYQTANRRVLFIGYKDTSIIEILLANGAKANIANANGWTPLHLLCSCIGMPTIALRDHEDIFVHYRRSVGAQVEAKQYSSVLERNINALLTNSTEKLELLTKRTRYYKWAPLHLACLSFGINIVKLLLPDYLDKKHYQEYKDCVGFLPHELARKYNLPASSAILDFLSNRFEHLSDNESLSLKLTSEQESELKITTISAAVFVLSMFAVFCGSYSFIAWLFQGRQRICFGFGLEEGQSVCHNVTATHTPTSE